MRSSLQLHSVSAVEVGASRHNEEAEYYVRTLVISGEDGDTLEIDLFSHEADIEVSIK
jgi:hypothetical protein